MKSHVGLVRRRRRASIVVLAALFLVAFLGMAAFAVDVGYIMVVKTQLQVAVDSAAMAATASMSGTADDVRNAAKQFAGYHTAGGKAVALTDAEIEFGTWDVGAATFTPSDEFGNAVRVTAHRNNSTGGNNLWFGRIFGQTNFSTQASAIAMGNPRDIALVVDMSGSMNDDTEPCWAANELTSAGHGDVVTSTMTALYSDFNFGDYPGTLQWVGAPAGVAATNKAYANLTKNGGPLTGASIAATYKILSTDSESTRKTKAYKWIIDNQLAALMPNALPAPNSGTNYGYWEKYLDYVIQNVTVNSGEGTPPSSRGAIPPNQDSDRITGFNNPNTTSFPGASSSVPQSYRNQLGYRTYVQFMLDFGRDYKPDGSNFVPLSVSSPNCQYHSEATAGGTFSFPPREQPVHACRRSLIAAIQEIKERNDNIPDLTQRDYVSVVRFDKVAGTTVIQSLTGEYDDAMTACTTLQAVGDNAASTATETGMIAAKDHIKPASQGGSGRENTQKVIVVLTDGMPNLYSSSGSSVSSYRTSNPSSEWYGGGSYALDAPLMQAMSLEALGWKIFAVGVGLGTDYSFMDRLARLGSTADDSGESPHTSGDPSSYETELSAIFEEIITNPQVRLVK